jgi:NTP pyrophosphatase (non-canonical NTP hydrolase)
MQIGEFQRNIERTYYDRDAARGVGGTFMWFIEEVGELSTAIREGDPKAMKGEFADVLAWLCTLASLAGVSMEEAVEKYANGCPRCHRMPCGCSRKL